jgi:glutamine synthetase
MLQKAEYIWLDGNSTPQLRSKVKVIDLIEGQMPPVWGFDGSSTLQAEGSSSDCVLYPAFVCKNPLEKNAILVLCEVLNPDMSRHSSNTRQACARAAKIFETDECWFGMEQEYVLVDKISKRPAGWALNNEPAPQGDYYCGNGASLVAGRKVVGEHLDACLEAGLQICGTNAEVMLGQWEFQIGPLGPVEMSDQLWVARFLLQRIAEEHGMDINYDAKPIEGDWNGSGCHTNFSTQDMRASGGYTECEKACEALGKRADYHIKNYGTGADRRLTGKHETCSYKEFRWGVSDRGASIRIPWQVAKEKRGYIEDRRPNADCDPYVVTRLITETVCGRTTNETTP